MTKKEMNEKKFDAIVKQIARIVNDGERSLFTPDQLTEMAIELKLLGGKGDHET